MTIKTAIILCGGFGTRLRSVVSDLPKSLALINGRHFIFYVLDQLNKSGVTTVILSTHYMWWKFSELLGNEYNGMTILYSREEFPLGTGGAIKKSLELTTDKEVLVMNGDDWLDIDFNKLYNFYYKNNYSGIIAAKNMKDASRYGTILLSVKDKIIGFKEKEENTTGFISTGIYILNEKLFYYFPLRSSFSIEYDCFPHWVKYGLGAYTTNAKFIDIGTPESYLEAQTYIK